MNKDAKIYIAGHMGMVGSAIHRNLLVKGYWNFVLRTMQELDLIDQKAVSGFFMAEKPEYVILAAAKVGGILANNTQRAQFIYENIMIQNNIIHHAFTNDVKKLLFLGSSCIYPKDAPQPIREEYLLTGPLEYTNEPYAIAKIAGIKMCESYNLQYGTDYISVMPTNLYGPNDNYNLKTSHVLPAMIRKMHLAHLLELNDWVAIRADFEKRPMDGITRQASDKDILTLLTNFGINASHLDAGNGHEVSLSLWGTGTPRREFLHADELADACVFLMESVSFRDMIREQTDNQKAIRNTHINIGSGTDLSILDLAMIVKKVTGFHGEIRWDPSMPDGTFRKLLDVSKLNKLGWSAKTTLAEGIATVYRSYIQ